MNFRYLSNDSLRSCIFLILIGTSAAHAAEVFTEGNTATHITNLDCLEDVYDVEFVDAPGPEVYGPPGHGEFPFPPTSAGGTREEQTFGMGVCIHAALNTAGTMVNRVGPEDKPNFLIAAGEDTTTSGGTVWFYGAFASAFYDRITDPEIKRPEDTWVPYDNWLLKLELFPGDGFGGTRNLIDFDYEGAPFGAVVVDQNSSVTWAVVTRASGAPPPMDASVGGNVTGLIGNGLVLANVGTNDEPIVGDGPFTFEPPVQEGSSYSVTVRTQPHSPNQICRISSGSGTVPDEGIDNVVVSCVDEPSTPDTDFDGISDTVDNCPEDYNPGQENGDGDAFGDACDISPVFAGIIGLPDLNDNGFAEVGVTIPGSTRVHIRDGNTGSLINNIDFGDDPVSAMVTIDDINGNGMPEIALLGLRPDNNVRVQVKDSQTGAAVNTIFYGSGFSAIDMTVLPDTNDNGADELVVVGADSNGGVRAQAQDALTDAITSTTYYGTSAQAQGVLTLADLSTNSEPEVLMHGRVISSGQDRAQMKDSSSGGLLSNIFFGATYSPVELAVIEDISGDGIPDLAQLSTQTDSGAIRVQVKNSANGALISTAYTGSNDTPITVIGIGDANSNGSPDVAILVENVDGTAKVIIRDGATGEQIRNTFAPAVSNPVAMSLVDDLDSSGDPELAILGDNGAGAERVQIRDSISGVQVNTIDF